MKFEKFDIPNYKVTDLQTTYIAGKRHYLTPSGESYPSVTTVTELLKKDIIDNWKKRVGEKQAAIIGGYAGKRGHLLHSICEEYILSDGKIIPDTVEAYPIMKYLFSHLKPAIDTNIEGYWTLELPLYSDRLRTAGRVDCVAKVNGEPTIIDFKTSGKPKLESYIENYFIQAYTYAAMWQDCTGMPINNIMIMMVVDTGEVQIFRKSGLEEKMKHLRKFLTLRREYDRMYVNRNIQ